MRTQWNVGPAGPIGLRYEALPTVMRLVAVPTTDRTRVFSDLQVMEAEALDVMRED